MALVNTLLQVKLIVTSGLVTLESADLPPGALFCGKPCAPQQLMALVNTLLGPTAA
jgi:hypothetical protein